MARIRTNVLGILDVTGLSFTCESVTVTDAVTALPTTPMRNRKAISVRNWSDNIVYLGGSSVTTATGWPVQPRETQPFDMSATAQLYGICDTGLTADVRVLQIDNG